MPRPKADRGLPWNRSTPWINEINNKADCIIKVGLVVFDAFFSAVLDGYFKRNNVQGFTALLGITKAPVSADRVITQQGANLSDDTADIDYRMSGKNLWQPLGQIAGQAAVRSFVQEQIHGEGLAIVLPVSQFDVIGTLAGIAEEGFEKIIGPFFRENCRQIFRGQNSFYRVGCHKIY